MQLLVNTYFGDNNRYYLEKLLGRGGFSEVWLVKDTLTDQEEALKIYAPGTGMDDDGLKMFTKELSVVHNIHHTNLLTASYVGVWQNMPYLIMLYCAKGSCVKKIGALLEEDIWKLIKDVSSGLSYLHNHDIIHQDIKPDNILIDAQGNYVITDFGISTRAQSTLRKSVRNAGNGTSAYMGPERFGTEPLPVKASDIWSLGATIFELIEGYAPFGDLGGLSQKSGADLPIIKANVSDALKYTVYKMLSKETWNRPTAETLVAWSQKPQSIDVDYGILTPDNRSVDSNRPTQLFSHDSTTGNVHSGDKELRASVTQPSLPKSKTKKYSLSWVVVVLLVLFYTIVFLYF